MANTALFEYAKPCDVFLLIFMSHEDSRNSFIDELWTHVHEHHHFPNKHTRLLSRVKYTHKKINDGTLDEWKKEQFLEVAIKI